MVTVTAFLDLWSLWWTLVKKVKTNSLLEDSLRLSYISERSDETILSEVILRTNLQQMNWPDFIQILSSYKNCPPEVLFCRSTASDTGGMEHRTWLRLDKRQSDILLKLQGATLRIVTEIFTKYWIAYGVGMSVQWLRQKLPRQKREDSMICISNAF